MIWGWDRSWYCPGYDFYKHLFAYKFYENKINWSKSERVKKTQFRVRLAEDKLFLWQSCTLLFITDIRVQSLAFSQHKRRLMTQVDDSFEVVLMRKHKMSLMI